MNIQHSNDRARIFVSGVFIFATLIENCLVFFFAVLWSVTVLRRCALPIPCYRNQTAYLYHRMAHIDVMPANNVANLIGRQRYMRSVVDAMWQCFYPNAENLDAVSAAWTTRSRAMVFSLFWYTLIPFFFFFFSIFKYTHSHTYTQAVQDGHRT